MLFPLLCLYTVPLQVARSFLTLALFHRYDIKVFVHIKISHIPDSDASLLLLGPA